MIEVELEFKLSATRLVLEKLLSLPETLRPTHESLAENEVGDEIGDAKKFAQNYEIPLPGVFLRNPSVLYDIRKHRNGTLICCGYFNQISLGAVKDFLIHIASARPAFGFACVPEERKFRNRVTTRQGLNTIESWVGRDTQKYIPGLYWLTLLPAELAEKHGVPLSVVGENALEHLELEGHQHLFRFYEKPEDWQSTGAVNELCSSLPGIFDVEKIRSQLESAKNFMELNAIVNAWK